MQNNGISFIMSSLKMKDTSRKSVSQDEYEQFKRTFIFSALEGKRFGQAFCEYFEIDNSNPLYFFKDNNISERWILDNYIINEEKIR